MTTAALLERCTDGLAMRELLQRALPGFAPGRLEIDAVRVLKARRSASLHRNPHPITLCYELAVREPGNAAPPGVQLLYGKMFRGGASAACFESIDATRLVRPAFGEPLAHVPELDMVCWALPNDPGLPQLAALTDAGRARPLLPWPALQLDPARCTGVRVQMLRYDPENRATLRYEVDLQGRPAPLVLYAKTFTDDRRGRDVDERFSWFWRQAEADPAAPLVARPLGHDAATHTAWQAAATGVPLGQALNDGLAAAPLLAREVARALAAVQAAPLPARRERPLAHWLAELERRQTKIARAEPALAGRARALTGTLARQAAQWPAVPQSLIHGDFHPEQLWWHDGRIVLFDFDEFTLGDPLEDVAEFAVKAGAHRAAWAREFVAASASTLGPRFDRARLRWHEAVQCLLQASRAFVFQRPGWRNELETWLARAEAHAAGPAGAAHLGAPCAPMALT